MGLALTFTAAPLAGAVRPFAPADSPEAAAKVRLRAARALANAVDVEPLVAFVEVESDDEEAWVTLHPAAEPVFLTTDDDGALVASCKTSTAGPGYHAFLVRLLERIAPALGIQWRTEDESEYTTKRDFVDLQDEMAHFMTILAGGLLQMYDANTIDGKQISMPANMHPLGYRGALTMRGPVAFRAFEVLAKGGANARKVAATLFPWWNESPDAAFHLGWAETVAWSRFSFRKPETDEELELYAALQRSFGIAREAGLLTERRAKLATAVEEAGRGTLPLELLPGRGPVGYRRGTWRKDLGAGWTVELPGWLEFSVDEENWLVWTSDRVEVRAAATRLAPGHDWSPRAFDGTTFRPEVENAEVAAGEFEAIDGVSCFRVSARAGDTIAYLMISVMEGDTAAIQWARATANSLEGPRP